ncbi:MAG: hypothetical protein CMM25_06190 [Rhodospirillaceae bacterium]|nr:hypothetical protein [Rhodospirillaceae bacterium]
MVLNFADIDNGISVDVLEKFTQNYQRPHPKNFFTTPRGKENKKPTNKRNIKNKNAPRGHKKERFANTITYGATAPAQPPTMLNPPAFPPGGATVIPPKPAVTLTATMITQQQLLAYGRNYGRSDTVDQDDENAYDPDAGVSTPEVDPKLGEKKSYRVPTDEDMVCWLYKYFVEHSGAVWPGAFTLKTFSEAIISDHMHDSGRKNKSQKAIMIENSDYWGAIKNRAREYVELWLENDIDFASKGIPEPYCMVKPTLTNEQAAQAYDDEIEANPLKALVGTEEISPAEVEYGEPPKDNPPPGCEPKWAYRKCNKNDKKESKCRKLKGPERDKCEENAQGCNADPNWCVKRSGMDALMAFMRSMTNVKVLYLALILGPIVLGVIFPPFAALSGLGMLGATLITPLVGYLHFYRLFGPGSVIFEALPHFIRWYFWYPIILLIAKPKKLFKIVSKGIKKFFTKTIPNGFIKLFTKQIPKLVSRIVQPIVEFATLIFDGIADFFALIGKSVMGFFKVIAQFFENVGREIGVLFENIVMTPIKGIQNIMGGFEKFFKDIGKAFGEISGIGKAISRIIKKIGIR